jgi:diguanylate cyclase (GGDEF)-like protein
VADVALGLMSPDTVLSMSTGFGLMYFELIVFELATAVFVVMLYRERAYTLLTMAAGTDALTGTANRGAFLIQAARLLRRAYANGEPASVIVFDLDHFKEINDRHGHAAGDRVLRSFAETARAVLRPGDLLGRLGGEEFAAMLPGVGTDTAFNIAERVRDAFEIATAVTVPSTVSAGVAAANSSLEEAMECADLALYRAKAVGRNRVERAPEPTPRKVSIVRVA